MELKNRDIKPMKKYLIIILTLLFVGCSSISIKSDNGSFRSSLDPIYYEKTTYMAFERPGEEALINVDIDEVIQRGRINAYNQNIYMIGYSRVNKNGVRPDINEDTLLVFFYRIYIEDKKRGFKIIIQESLRSVKKYFNFVTYQEVSKNEKGEYVIHENISEEEATRKRVKWEDTRM